ncbi:MAG: hypothetical protein E7316_05375 [Clostridiales bacterium]|nr:hypothetical protein [Clostridiales bacterium]
MALSGCVISFTVCGSVLPGDVNEDGVVNAYDALLVLQYSAGWNVTPNKELADANGDGVISIADAL